MKKIGLGVAVALAGAFIVGQVWLEGWDSDFRLDATSTAAADASACLDYWDWSQRHNARIARLFVLFQETPIPGQEDEHDRNVAETLQWLIDEMGDDVAPQVAREFAELTVAQFKIELEIQEQFLLPEWSSDKVMDLSSDADKLTLPIQDAKRDLISRCGF